MIKAGAETWFVRSVRLIIGTMSGGAALTAD